MSRPRPSLRGQSVLRLRVAMVVIAMALSVLGARLVQLQGVDPDSYAEMAAAEGTVDAVLPAQRGEILDRNGVALASSVDGMMVIVNPQLVPEDAAPELARLLSDRLDVDYFDTLAQVRDQRYQFRYVARRVPSTVANETLEAVEDAGFDGITLQADPVRDYPAKDVAANLVGFMGAEGEPRAGLELTFEPMLHGTDGEARYSTGGGNRIPLGETSTVDPVNGQDLTLTIDRDVQWFVQRALRNAVEGANADSGVAIVQDVESGEILALADHPTFDASQPLLSDEADLGSRALSDVYEPGSVQKAFTLAALLDADEVSPTTRITVPPELDSGDTTIGDYWDHGTLRLTVAGAIAQSSNIGTVLAARRMDPERLHDYLVGFGEGSRTDVGVRGESAGILPDGAIWTPMAADRIAFGQSLSVNALQMTAGINTIANGGVHVSPSLVRGSATTAAGEEVGTDQTERRRVVSEVAARQTSDVLEQVVDPETGVAPGAAVPGYRVAGKTGTAQRVNDECQCYDGTFTVSFGGFAPADAPRFTVYVAIQNPRNGGGGGSVGGPAFSSIMGQLLRHYAVPPTNSRPPELPIEW
ncbi:penicillin-binding protein 2 [Nocardioides sp. CFH 31398]|uniref:peptidoglycan D,D-transpeptidase FtsI family protein n=1 Tax=Nocardioides sp. CFH 31398 TaxID=2919579 RepID=UPI001F06BD25|nr:penicillin-binding protein 2 [Nocardioides sp. CFH 31398]MCH1868273.1 penicillin-binding protein 2 [Nocardioides sp. CFH 31398]